MQVSPGGKIFFSYKCFLLPAANAIATFETIKWTVFVFTESWSHDHCHTKGLLSLDPRFGSFMVGFLLKRVHRHLPYKPLKLLFGKKKVLGIPLSHKSNDPSWLSISSAFSLLLSTSHPFLWQSISQNFPIDREWWDVAIFAAGYYFSVMTVKLHNTCIGLHYTHGCTT